MNIIKNYKNIESCVCIDSGKTGKNICIFSGIHGNEKSPILATKKFFEKIEKNEIKINFGKVFIVFKANKYAVKENKREIKYNMNRLFRDNLKNRKTYEETRSLELMNLLKEVDYLLDLHSTSGPSIPFLFAELKNFEFAKKLGISHIVGGWGELSKGVISGDTENYINSLGGVGVTFEAGNHDSLDGEKNAYQAILNFLIVLGVIDKNFFKEIGEKQKIYTKIEDVYIAKTNNFKYSIKIKNFLKLKKDTLIGIDGEKKVFAPYDMVLLMPKKQEILKKDIEVFLIAKQQ